MNTFNKISIAAVLAAAVTPAVAKEPEMVKPIADDFDFSASPVTCPIAGNPFMNDYFFAVQDKLSFHSGVTLSELVDMSAEERTAFIQDSGFSISDLGNCLMSKKELSDDLPPVTYTRYEDAFTDFGVEL